MSTQTIQDGGGKLMPANIVLKSNTTYQNYIITGNLQFLSDGLALQNVKILNCIFQNITGTPIFIANFQGTAPASSNIEVANCTMTNYSGNQYYWQFQNCSGLLIHDNQFTSGAPTTFDGGVIYAQMSSGQFYRMRCDTFHGKFIRLWPAANSTTAIYNIIAINSDKYSAIEIQEFAGQNQNATISIDNCTLGDFPLVGGVDTGAATLYNLATTKYSFGATKFNKVFNTSKGLLDNGGNTSGPFAPTNANWQTINKYFATMQAAGYANDAAVLLPDGTAWNAAAVTPPPVVVPPIVVTPGPAKKIVEVQTVTDANGNVLSTQTFTTNL